MKDPIEFLLPNAIMDLDKRWVRLKRRVWMWGFHIMYKVARDKGWVGFQKVVASHHAQERYNSRFDGEFYAVLVNVMMEREDARFYDSRYDSTVLFFQDEDLVLPIVEDGGMYVIPTCYSRTLQSLLYDNRFELIEGSTKLQPNQAQDELDDSEEEVRLDLDF